MLASRAFEPPDLLVATVRGVLTSHDQEALIAWVRDSVAAGASVRVLIRLEEFAGWNPTGVDDGAAFWLKDDDRVSRIAIVGDAAWRVSVLTTMGQPLRALPIEYFATEAAARLWLGAGDGAAIGPADPAGLRQSRNHL